MFSGILFLNAVIVNKLLVAPFLAPSYFASLQLNGGMQYFTSVITTIWLHGLDGIYCNLGKSIENFMFRFCQGII